MEYLRSNRVDQTQVFRGSRTLQRVIFHIGAHKTGTSAFQRWLTHNYPLLDRSGIAIPTGLIGQTGNASSLAKALSKQNRLRTPSDAAEVEALSLFSNANAHRPLFFSAEYFETANSVGQLGFVSDLMDEWRRGEKTAVLIVRNQIDLKNSNYGQSCKSLTRNHPFRLGRRKGAPVNVRDWDECRTVIQDSGFVPRIGVYRGKEPGYSIARQVMDLSGLLDYLPADTDFSTTSVNDSIGELGCIVGRHLHGVLEKKPHAEAEKIRGTLSQMLITACKAYPDQPFNGFTAGERADVRAFCQDSNLALGLHLDGGIDEARLLLGSSSDDRKKSPVDWSDLTQDQVEIVLSILEDVTDMVMDNPQARRLLNHHDILPTAAQTGSPQFAVTRSPGPVPIPKERPKRQNLPNAMPKKHVLKPPATWINDPWRMRLTLPRIRASLSRRIRGILGIT